MIGLQLRKLLTLIAWALILIGMLTGIWQLLDAFGPSGEILGGPLFIFRYLLSVLGGVLTGIVPGITLLLVLRLISPLQADTNSQTAACVEKT